MTNYELNKQIVADSLPLTIEEINQKKEMLTKYFEEDWAFMLLCKDLSYYTVFLDRTNEQPLPPKFADEVIDCLQSIGSIKGIDLNTEQNAVEIWIHPLIAEPAVAYLFPYSEGVIECRA